MKNVLITIFFILSFAPMFAQTVPEKEIDFEGSFIMDDARSASLPIEAYLQDTQVVLVLVLLYILHLFLHYASSGDV